MPHNVWSLTVFLLGPVSLCLLPVLCCRPKEYETEDGQCCPMCHEGTVVIRHCSLDSGTRCGPCATGTYMNQPNGRTSCFSCHICQSDLGLVELLPCSSVRNRVCGARSGFFCERFSDGGSCEAAQKHSTCSPGQRVKEPGTSSTDAVCEDCPEETFSVDGTNCTAWTRCSETQVEVREGSRQEDVLCAQASRNHIGLILSLTLLALPLSLLVVYKLRGRSDPNEGSNDQSLDLSPQPQLTAAGPST